MYTHVNKILSRTSTKYTRERACDLAEPGCSIPMGYTSFLLPTYAYSGCVRCAGPYIARTLKHHKFINQKYPFLLE